MLARPWWLRDDKPMSELEKTEGAIRVATFNLKHGAYADKYRGNPEEVAEACKSLGADILALQEVDKGTFRAGFKDLAALAAEASGMEVVFAQTIKYRIGRYGNALLVKGGISDSVSLELGGGPRFRKHIFGRERTFGYEPRNAILARAHIDKRQVWVAATHLSTNKNDALTQLSTLSMALSRREEPQVLLGDFNLSRNQVARVPRLKSFELAEEIPTFPALNPAKMIDHIAVKGLTIVTAREVLLPVSDHRALVAEIA
jgi:endonuclease/exonuclease/phosphatase family metal-dependent hydrolase